MKLRGTLNGEPVEIEVELRGALNRREAAKYLSIGLTKLGILVGLGEVQKTPYDTYPVEALNEYLRGTHKAKPC